MFDILNDKVENYDTAPNPLVLCFEQSFAIAFKTFVFLLKKVCRVNQSEETAFKRVKKLLQSHFSHTITHLDMTDKLILSIFETKMMQTPLGVNRDRHLAFKNDAESIPAPLRLLFTH
jgi:hypothetical protein